MFEVCLSGFTTMLKNRKLSEQCLDVFLMTFEKMSTTNDFGGRFIDIGLEHVAVAAARVVGGPSRCSKK